MATRRRTSSRRRTTYSYSRRRAPSRPRGRTAYGRTTRRRVSRAARPRARTQTVRIELVQPGTVTRPDLEAIASGSNVDARPRKAQF